MLYRAKRRGEVHGVDYIFVSRGEFESWIDQGQLLEHATVYGEYKGIPKQQGPRAVRGLTPVPGTMAASQSWRLSSHHHHHATPCQEVPHSQDSCHNLPGKACC